MQLVSSALAQECAMGAIMVGYFMYYYESWILPAMMRQEKTQYNWSAAHRKYHENIFRLNGAYDRELRYSAISRNLLMGSIHHTAPKDMADHISRMITTNKKVYDALNPASQRRLAWQVQPALQ